MMMTKLTKKTVVLLAACIAGTVSASAQNANNILVDDTRDINALPSTYGRNVKFEFKTRAALAVPGSGFYSGLMTIAPWGDNSGDKDHQLDFNNGGIFYRQGLPEGNWENWQKLIIGDASNNVALGNVSGTNMISNNFATTLTDNFSYDGKQQGHYALSWKDDSWQINGASAWLSGFGGIKFFTSGVARMAIRNNGSVGIGTTNPTELLSVNGNVRARKVIVTPNGWADYVFDSSYRLRPLSEVENFIRNNNHLPDMPAATEVEEKGLNLGEIVKQQQVKIEELTLYLIELKKENMYMRNINYNLQKEIQLIKKKLK
jgi:hypothetical protein